MSQLQIQNQFQQRHSKQNYLSPKMQPYQLDSDKISETSTTSQQESNEILHYKLKRSLCKNFLMYGYCPYGFKCQFAHGVEELQCNHNLNHHYKTKICNAFTKKGYCAFGDRCNFIHQKNFSKKDWKIKHTNFGQIFRQQRQDARQDMQFSSLLMMLEQQIDNQDQSVQKFPSLFKNGNVSKFQ